MQETKECWMELLFVNELLKKIPRVRTRAVAGGSSTFGDPNNTAPSNPNTTVTNTGIKVGRPAPASSSNNPLNVIKQ